MIRDHNEDTTLGTGASCYFFKINKFKFMRSRLARGKDGRFKDTDLAGKLQDATETVAEAPGYRATSSEELELVDQARRLNAYTLNDYRRYLGLKRLSHKISHK